MQVNDDKDIKIVGDKPSVDVKNNLEKMIEKLRLPTTYEIKSIISLLTINVPSV